MNSNNTSSTTYTNNHVGVIGSGIFGIVMANVLAKNRKVFIYTERDESKHNILVKREVKGVKVDESIEVISDPQHFAETCGLIVPLVRARDLRSRIRKIAPFLQPDHIIIHGIKGFDVNIEVDDITMQTKIDRRDIKTMSEVILEETVVKRVGCFSGPNLAREISEEKLAATVVASHFDEVLYEGQKALENKNFKVFYSHDLKGVELTGVLKNIMAIAAGALDGLGFGENAKALLISRGLAELTWIGKTLGFEASSFLGLAGIGDLVATCSSPLSRNFTVGYKVAKGQALNDILTEMEDVAEGIGTVKIVNGLANFYNFKAPITHTLFKVLFENLSVEEGVNLLMHLPTHKDVDFL